jgi:hypothetical protein
MEIKERMGDTMDNTEHGIRALSDLALRRAYHEAILNGADKTADAIAREFKRRFRITPPNPDPELLAQVTRLYRPTRLGLVPVPGTEMIA